ncbi:MAG: lytic transglycosylase domain-containing protein [bacterium]|nr:lytic transglycosylase domain-containing protein [bacterium]
MWRPRIHGRIWPRALCLLSALLLTAQAEVQVKTLADGTKMVFNESTTQRARRTASKLVPVPSSEIALLIDVHAGRQGLDPRLVQAVMQVESGYNPRALSSKGAIGLMQLMPDTARMLEVTDPWDPEDNIRGGTLYLRRMLQRFDGSLRRALAAYNAGPTAVARYDDVPPYRETRNFVQRVLGLYYGNASALPDLARARTAKPREASAKPKKGAKVYLTRDKNNKIVVTTSSPKSN